jgi:hypothetical protein
MARTEQPSLQNNALDSDYAIPSPQKCGLDFRYTQAKAAAAKRSLILKTPVRKHHGSQSQEQECLGQRR